MRGDFCENLALQYYLQHNYVFVRRKWKSPFAEVDLVMRSPEGDLVLIEVKSVTSMEFLSVRLSPQQKRRLERVLIYCSEREPRVRLELAIVSRQGRVQVFPVFQ